MDRHRLVQFSQTTLNILSSLFQNNILLFETLQTNTQKHWKNGTAIIHCFFCLSNGAHQVFVLIQLCIRFSVPLVIMMPDGLWQTRPGIIRSWSWQSISDSGGVCAAVSIFIIWFVIPSDSCYSNHCTAITPSTTTPAPTPPPPRILPGLFHHFNNSPPNVTATKVWINCTPAPSVTLLPRPSLLAVTFDFMHNSPPPSPPPLLNYIFCRI